MNKVIPFWYRIVEAIAIDFEKDQFTWKDAYSTIFIYNTDIYKLMIYHLKILGINLNSKITIKDIQSKVGEIELTFKTEKNKEGNGVFIILSDSQLERIWSKKNVKSEIKRLVNQAGYEIIN